MNALQYFDYGALVPIEKKIQELYVRLDDVIDDGELG